MEDTVVFPRIGLLGENLNMGNDVHLRGELHKKVFIFLQHCKLASIAIKFMPIMQVCKLKFLKTFTFCEWKCLISNETWIF